MNKNNSNKQKEKFNLKPWLIVIGAILLIFAIVGVQYFFENYRRVYTFEYSNGAYYDPKTDVTYVSAPYCYTYVLKSEENYSKSNKSELYYIGCKDKDGQVHMASPSVLLATSVSEGGVIYYNPEKMSIPKTCDFDWDISYLCSADGPVHATHELDGATTNKLLEAYFDADQSENIYDSGAMYEMELLKQIRVTSKTYKYFYMVMYLYTDSKGSYYIASTYDQKMVKTDSSVFSAIFEENK